MRRVVFAIVAVVLAHGARAESPDILNRLMTEPVTLFDWGMARLEHDIAVAAARTLPKRIGRAETTTGSIYDWRTRLITVYASVELPREKRTQEDCVAVFRDIVTALTAAAPTGPNPEGWYLFNAFKPKAHWWGNRFEDIGAKLLAIVQLEVSFLPETYDALSGDTRRVRCVGRLDAEPYEIATEVTS
ncbi:MAG: hypothetical protein MJE12_00540 [Alphaproteobacteria bacterium]|nr:hypothetical protein [Alphaproteobacteria bacterium]